MSDLSTEDFLLLHGDNSIIERVQDIHEANIGMSELDAMGYALNKGVISAHEYDLVKPIILHHGLYSQFN